MEEVNRFLADVFIPAHNDLFGKAPTEIPVPSCPRRAGNPCHEPSKLFMLGTAQWSPLLGSVNPSRRRGTRHVRTGLVRGSGRGG